MKNYRAWEQIDFSGGMNLETPANQLEQNECKRLFNLFPTHSGKELVTRPGFGNAGLVDFGNPIISLWGYRGFAYDSEEEKLQAIPSLIAVERFDEGEHRLHAILLAPEGMTIPPQDVMLEDMYWVDGGTDYTSPIEGGHDIELFTPYVYNFAPEGAHILVPAIGGEERFQYNKDFWTSEDLLEIDWEDNNLNNWSSEEGIGQPHQSIYSEEYYNFWIDGGWFFNFFWDSWTWEDVGPEHGRPISNIEEGQLQFLSPVTFESRKITGGKVSPVFKPNNATFHFSKPTNAYVYFRFAYTEELRDAAFNIWFRKKDDVTWLPFNTKVGYGQVPIRMRDQEELVGVNEPYRWEGKEGGPNEGFITCGHRVPFANVEFRVDCRIMEEHYHNKEASGILHSILISGEEV